MPTCAVAAETGRSSPELASNTILVFMLTVGSLPAIAFVKPLGAADGLHFLFHLKATFRVTTPGDLGDPETDQRMWFRSDQQSPCRKPFLTQVGLKGREDGRERGNSWLTTPCRY